MAAEDLAVIFVAVKIFQNPTSFLFFLISPVNYKITVNFSPMKFIDLEWMFNWCNCKIAVETNFILSIWTTFSTMCLRININQFTFHAIISCL